MTSLLFVIMQRNYDIFFYISIIMKLFFFLSCEYYKGWWWQINTANAPTHTIHINCVNNVKIDLFSVESIYFCFFLFFLFLFFFLFYMYVKLSTNTHTENKKKILCTLHLHEVSFVSFLICVFMWLFTCMVCVCHVPVYTFQHLYCIWIFYIYKFKLWPFLCLCIAQSAMHVCEHIQHSRRKQEGQCTHLNRNGIVWHWTLPRCVAVWRAYFMSHSDRQNTESTLFDIIQYSMQCDCLVC